MGLAGKQVTSEIPENNHVVKRLKTVEKTDKIDDIIL